MGVNMSSEHSPVNALPPSVAILMLISYFVAAVAIIEMINGTSIIEPGIQFIGCIPGGHVTF